MLELDHSHLIGTGRTRDCFLHPLEPDKCIKIDRQKRGGATEKEARYYEKIARIRPGFSFVHIPRFHGFVKTSLGRGGVFDLIRDETTGEISKTLRDYIAAGEVSADDPQWLKAHGDYLRILYDEAIVVRDFNPGNLCARKMRDGGYQFVTIDGIGHREFFPLCDHFRWAARRTIRRQVRRKHFGSLAEILRRIEGKRKAIR